MRLVLISLLLLTALPAQALTIDTPLADLTQESRAEDLFHEIRCVVCKSQSLAESSADVAADMRREIRAQIAAGKSNKEVMEFLAQRYGEDIRLKPALGMNTLLLWFMPLGILAVAVYIALGYFRKRST